MRRVGVVMGAWLLALPVAAASPMGVQNARLEERSAAAGLEPAFRAALAGRSGPAWIGYAVPSLRNHESCCWDSSDKVSSCCGGCRLESGGGFTSRSGARSDGTVALESSGRLRVLFRVEGGAVDRIRTFSEGCALDAGGLPFVWLSDVRPAESLRLLATFVTPAEGKEGRKVYEGALAAVAFHADPGADALLEGFAAPGRPERLRKQAAFWMGNARGRRGFETLKRMIRDDPSEAFREHAVFALTQSGEPEAVDVIVETAKRDHSTRVRGQALFWLGQKAGRKASAAITQAIEDDPETDVKKKAVFALSQLPKDEGIPILIRTARENRNPAVRKQAMFWLGQSGDPRALSFFEEVLKK